MLPAELLGARPGERILDLCAAPGGKSCRIAADLAGEGLLWANDLSAERIRPLVRNLELMGVTNAIVSVEKPERLSAVLPGWFDRIIVDAPCSGAGMIRRDARALASYQARGPECYVREQAAILGAAYRLLRPGGRLVYSTCTFAREENELQIAAFLAEHPDCQPEDLPLRPGLSQGLPVEGRRLGIRIWPHRARGDGHFCAVLRKGADDVPGDGRQPLSGVSAAGLPGPAAAAGITLPPGPPLLGGVLPDCPSAYRRFLAKSLSEAGQVHLSQRQGAVFRLQEGHLHGLPLAAIPAGSLHLVKTGLYLGDLRQTSGVSTPDSGRRRDAGNDSWKRRDADRVSGKFRDGRREAGTRRDAGQGRQASRALAQPAEQLCRRGDSRLEDAFTPSHGLSHVLAPEDLRHAVDYPLESQPIRQYLRGETLLHPGSPAALPPPGSLVGIAAGGFLIGLARQMPDGHLKNLYPPAWRKHS